MSSASGSLMALLEQPRSRAVEPFACESVLQQRGGTRPRDHRNASSRAETGGKELFDFWLMPLQRRISPQVEVSGYSPSGPASMLQPNKLKDLG